MNVKRVSAPEAVLMQKVGYVIVDIRPPGEFEKGHPTAAKNVPFYFYTQAGGIRPNPDFESTITSLYPRDTKLLLIDKVGKRSPAAIEALTKLGYTELCDLRGGYLGILDGQGRPVENGWEMLGLPETMSNENSYAGAVTEARKALRKG